MLTDHFKHTATVSRSTVSGNKTTYAEVGSFACHIQPLSGDFTPAELGRSGRSFRMFSTSEVRIGDRIEDQDGKKYDCTGVEHHTFRNHTHYQATLRGL